MAFRAVQRQKKSLTVATAVKSANTPSSSTTSSSRLVPEVASVDEQSSPASSSAKSKPHSVKTSKENVTVTVRFRPLSPREIRQGEEIAWYADGDTIVRSENNSSVAYAYDRVFGPTTTTRHVYDVAAHHIVSGAMDGINGTIFAYGVTSSGKTHTMHGDQRSPGIIPLAVKDAFSIIQETPNREFLLRVSYLEIYNEVVNDLLNPTGQNLRIREDLQGTFVEGIKEEVVLSPAHALSLIATGEEHRHVGSTNFNLLSSRSHTIFTLTIESIPYGEYNESEAVNLSQLNLIDLAGSESSRVETTGLRRKEGAYINKSLLTLGTVISKLTEEKASHIPYRDSKLTRLLQSSLSGQGHISLICTVTPSSSNAEEMHNTLKFAHRAKCIEILAFQNKIIDEKSLIKKYQHEIRCLKEELEQLKKGMLSVNSLKGNGGDDMNLLRKKLEDGHVKLQSRLEQEEEAKAALLGRIQRLTKLILVSTKTAHSPRFHQRPVHRRRHSFGEEELSYLPFRRRDMIMDDENGEFFGSFEGCVEADYSSKEEKKNRKHGLLNWFKLKKRDSSFSSADGDKSVGTKSHTTPSTPLTDFAKLSSEARTSNILQSEISSVIARAEASLNGDVTCENALRQEKPLASTIAINHADLLREQLKILSEDVALSSSVLKRLSDEATNSPKKDQILVEIRRVGDEMKEKKQQIVCLEKAFAELVSANKCSSEEFDLSSAYAALLEQLNEKTFEVEVKAADNRVIQDQLEQKIFECEELKDTVTSLRLQLSNFIHKKNSSSASPTHCSHLEYDDAEDLKHKISELTEVKTRVELQNQKLAEESQYAKGLASAAGVELKALSEEVTKLMNRNEKLTNELSMLKNSSLRRPSIGQKVSRGSNHVRRRDPTAQNYEREVALEAALIEKEHRETELQKIIENSKQKETFLEAELSNMWALVAKLKQAHGIQMNDLE